MAKQKNRDNHPIFDLYVKALRGQRRANHEYWTNSAFIAGNQWIHLNPHTYRLEEVPADDDRVRATINRLWPDSRTVISKLLQRPLQFEVPPNSADDVAIEGAKLADSILAAVKKEHKWEDLRESTAWSVWKGGTAAICVDWNPNDGKPTAISKDGRTLKQGDTVETALSLAEFVVEPGVREAHTARWWIKAQALPPEQVKAMYNLSDTPPADATNGLSSLEKGIVASWASGNHGPIDRDAQAVDLTLVLTYYERPNPSTPEGKVQVIVNNESVWGPKKWPFPFKDRLNLTTCRETIVENTWLGMTVVSIARPIQAAFNAAWSNILEHADVAGNARLATPQSAVELTEQYTDKIGEQIIYADGLDKPSWITPPQLPAWLLQMPGELRAEIDDTLGVHDVSRGSAPANIESGYGLAVLAEQDATPIGKLASSMAEMFSDLGEMVLKIYEANVKETRKAKVETPGMPPDTVSWTGKDIAGQTDAVVPLELVAPRSRAAQAQFAERALQMGLITTLEEMSRLAEMPGEREMIAAVRPDVARARRENHAMAQGKVAFPENYDDHAIHIAEHNAFRKTARYEALDPEIRDMISNHVQAHETLAAEEAAKQQMAANVGGPALAAIPKADGSESLPVEGLEGGAVPPLDQQTEMDQLTGDVEGAIAREGAQEFAEGAAIEQQNLERDEILALAQIAQGGAL